MSGPTPTPLPLAVARAIEQNDLAGLNDALLSNACPLHAYFAWIAPSDTRQQPLQRTLLQIASWHAALDVMAALLASGTTDVNSASPDDGMTALHMACSHASSSTAKAIALLLKSGARRDALNAAGQSPCDLLSLEPQPVEPPSDSDSELTKPEYMTDDFRMHRFKIEVCPRLNEMHDWTCCPFQHPGEKARRRDPRQYRYQGVPCPDFRKGVCKRGDACTFAHGVFECWLHPSRYRTQLCKEGAACKRSVCFFAHAVDQLREPTMLLEGASQPSSPRGPLSGPAAEESQETSRSCSPVPASSEESVQLNASTESVRGLLRRAQSFGVPSADSSMSTTPVVDSGLAAAVQAETLQRSLSHLSLCSEDQLQQVAHAAALQACGAVSPAAALGLLHLQPPAPACSVQLPAGGAEALAYRQLAQQLGLHGLHGACNNPLVDAQAAQQQAAVLHAGLAGYHQGLALMQVQQAADVDPTAALLAAASMRAPLASLPASMHAGAPVRHHLPATGFTDPALAACLGMHM